MKHDYSHVRGALLTAIGLLEDARTAAGRTNLYPTMSPADARRQIDGIDALIDEVRGEIQAAREGCAALGRSRLRVAGEG